MHVAVMDVNGFCDWEMQKDYFMAQAVLLLYKTHLDMFTSQPARLLLETI